MGIAPTGSGKTLAYLLPLLADGLCQQRCAEAASLESLVLRFQQLYPRSFQGQTGRTGSVFRLLKPLVARNDQVFERLQRLHKAKKMTELTAAIKQVALKASGSEKDEAGSCRHGGFLMFSLLVEFFLCFRLESGAVWASCTTWQALRELWAALLDDFEVQGSRHVLQMP